IAAASKQPQDTLDFLAFLMGKDGQNQWLKLLGSRSISPVKEVAQSQDWIHYGGSSGQLILDSLDFSQPPPVNFGNASEAENAWTQEFGLVVSGDETVDTAVTNICQQLPPILSASK